MSDSILLAYATKYGSTQEVAEAIAATLRERGLEVDIQPMRQVRTLENYRAVVMGAPIYIFRLQNDARRFLSKHRQALSERPLAVFSLGPTHEDEKGRQEMHAVLNKELAKFPELRPVVSEMFYGKYDPAKLRFPDTLAARLPASPLYKEPANDARDWTAIRAWANDLAARLQPASS